MFIRDFLAANSARFEVLLHAPSHSAAHLAGSVHMPGRSVAKAVLVRFGEAYALAVLPSTHRIELARLAEVLNSPDVWIATEAEVEAIFDDCEPGALPPFGRPYGLTTLVDASLSAGSEVAFVGNTRHECIRMRFKDFERIESPIKARFAASIDAQKPRGRLQAG